MPLHRRSKPKVLIIGAGISGLAAARALHDAGYPVVVFEARERLGGRVYTRDGFDFGAHWIHGTEGNPLTDLAREAGLRMRFTGGDSTYTGTWERMQMRSRRGREKPSEAKIRSILAGDRWREELERWRLERERTGGPDRSVRQAIEEIVTNRASRKRPNTDALWHLLAWARDDSNADLDELSALNWDAKAEVYGYGDSVLPEGYSGLIEHLGSGLHVRTGVVVTRIHWSARGVEVHTRPSAQWGTVHRFDRVVVTVPLSVLKERQIRFDPPLPKEKHAAIRALGVGCLAKAGFRFREVWWPPRQYVFARQLPSGSQAEGEPAVLVNAHASHGARVLVLLIGGQAGRAFEAMPLDEAKAWAWQRIIETVGPEARAAGIQEPDEHDFFRTDWTRDRFAGGGYSFLKVGATSQHVEDLARPVGPLHFAGEATSVEHLANAHGAYLSGLRAAVEITGDRSLLPQPAFTENRRFREMRHRAQRFFDLHRPSGSPSQRTVQSTLAKHPAFAALDEADLRVLASQFQAPEKLAPGCVLCREDEWAKEMFLVVTGQLDVYVKDGKAWPGRLRRHIRAGELAGDFAVFLDDRRRTGTLIVGPRGATIHRCPYQALERFLQAFPESTLKLCAIAVRETRAAMKMLQKPETNQPRTDRRRARSA